MADRVIGLNGGFTRRARRRICHAGVDNSFERGERTPQELTGWSVDAEAIRRLGHSEATGCRKSKGNRLDVTANFAKTPGDWELQIDAGKVNTETGWRDVKVATFAIRKPAQPCTSEADEKRDLPEPSVRHTIAGIETAEAFGPRCKAGAETIGLPDVAKLTVLGDGAAWIWDPSADHFAGAEQTLDVYHATEYPGELARAGFGVNTEASKAWTDRAQLARLADGRAGVCEFVQGDKAEASDPSAVEAAFPRVAHYLSGHQNRMLYAARLRRGASIGSGMIEGEIVLD